MIGMDAMDSKGMLLREVTGALSLAYVINSIHVHDDATTGFFLRPSLHLA